MTGFILNTDGKQLPGVAPVKTTQQMDELAPKQEETFANPMQIIHQVGLQEGMSVADFGSGSGLYTLAASVLVGNTGEVFAIDVQKDLLNRIKTEADKNGHTNIKPIWGNLDTRGGSKLADGSVDIVFLSNILFQLEHKDETLLEAWRVLKPKGKLMVVDWTDSFNGMGPQTEMLITKEQAYGLCVHNGFVHKEDFQAGTHHYGMLFTKEK